MLAICRAVPWAIVARKTRRSGACSLTPKAPALLDDLADRFAETRHVPRRNEQIRKVVSENIARPRRIVGHGRKSRGQLLNHGHAKPFDVTRERAKRAVRQKLRKLIGIKLRNNFQEIDRTKLQIVPDTVRPDHRA